MPAKLELPDISEKRDNTLDIDHVTSGEEDLGMQLLDLFPYNVFHILHKANKIFPVRPIAFKPFSYGPYKVQSSLYTPWPPIEDVANRILALSESLKTAKPDDPLLLQKKIHLADLKAIKSRINQNPEDIQSAIADYAAIYQDVPKDIYPDVALNMANSLLLNDDVVTALPLAKKISKDLRSDKSFRQALHATFIELYYLSGRYEKAWDEMQNYVTSKEVVDQNADYRIRVGDVLFFLGKYQEAADWYQLVLKAEPTKEFSENVSWLYLAESVHQTGNLEVSRKIFTAMQSYFKDTVYADVIRYRLDPSPATADAVLASSKNPSVKKWLHVEKLKWQFKQNPEMLPGDSFAYALVDQDYPTELSQQLWAMQAYSYAFEKKYYAAIALYQKLFSTVKNPFLHELLDQIMADLVVKRGLSNTTEKQAYQFLKFMKRFEFRLRTSDPEKIFSLLKHNLDLMGMKEVAAEMTLHIIEKSIPGQQERTKLYLRMAEGLHDAGMERPVIRALDLVDTKLLDFEDRDVFYRISFENLSRNKRDAEALETLNLWEKEGTSAKNFYWIALKKAEIQMARGDDDQALKTVENAVGTGDIASLPEDFNSVVNPLLALKVVLHNKFNRNYESLAGFFAHEARIMKSDQNYNAMMAALSSALAMNKAAEIDKLLAIAKTNFDKTTYDWLHQWASGELWINQIDGYLNQHTVAQEKSE